jgi:hypothetical protein
MLIGVSLIGVPPIYVPPIDVALIDVPPIGVSLIGTSLMGMAPIGAPLMARISWRVYHGRLIVAITSIVMERVIRTCEVR